MDIADIKRWQWILIGLIAGLGLGYVWSGMEPGDGGGQQISQLDFERDVTRKYKDQPLIRNIVIQPATTDYAGKKVQPVSFRRMQIGQKSGKIYFVPAQFVAMIPYKPMMNAPPSMTSQFMLTDYLANLKRRNDAISYGYGWWQEKPATIAIWAVGMVFAVGIVWPTLLNMMVGAGMRPPKEKKAKKDDYFDRFSHHREPEKTSAARVVGDAERQRLDDMNRALEARLAGAGVFDPERDPETEAEEAEVRKLQAGALEATPAMQKPGDDDEIEVKGEFYPVLIHHKKHHDDEEPPPAKP
ncbi:hypothetical protein BH09PLA1_BH09PLA1_33170 [soil metagenome]